MPESLRDPLRAQIEQALPILERGDIPFGDMVSHVLPLDRVDEGFQALNGTYRLGAEFV